MLQTTDAIPVTQRAGSLTLADMFLQQVALNAQGIALQDDRRQLTYQELNSRVNRLAHAMRSLGVAPGDRVAVLSENRIEYIELEMAAAKLGCILACQNWRQSDGELEHCIRLVSPRLVFCSARYRETLSGIDHGVERTIDIDGEYEAMLDGRPDTEPGNPSDPEVGLIILYTSGTTGLPKGALISQRAMIARATISRLDSTVLPGDTFVAWAPLFHMVSTDSVYGTLATGGKVIVMDGLDVPTLMRIAAREPLGHLVLMPGMIDRVIEELQATGLQPMNVRSIGCMADLVPLDQIATVTRLFRAPFKNSFGSTETGTAPASRGLIPVDTIPKSLAKEQSSHCAIRLVDESDNDVPDGMPGELAFRGPSLFSGYWAAPEVNEREFRNGWFHMGDMFVRNADGTLDFVDRRKYLIKSGGENIYPAEIERVLLACDRIREAVVVRRPDAKWGEVPVAFVTKGDDALSADDVVAHCRGKIASYKLPKQVVFIEYDAFPRSTTGKVKRHELESLLPG